ncbi:hypothetical protein GP486_007041 [Trichoglossum hirsutum]|uniref:Uncharacterized protein n=1 Tax=Trichoglossum hirsutum TaxID=265104 RepID=A0A9P8L7P4_9PEZI|nr:hypothetical protein GP486_007041 [Trichoglossum hirsutum]
MTLSHSLNEDIATLEYEGEAEVNRRNKRRKLDVDSCGAGLSGFSYGRYGQVEPGELNMQIVSCDGGNYKEDDGGSGDYLAENVLRKDTSVYCTKSNRCNLVLRHKGGTAFTLTELDIKAPRRGYTAPVREGMVFISMTSSDLLSRAARYQIRYSPPPPHILPGSVRMNSRQSRRSTAPQYLTPDAAQMETYRIISELNRRSDLNYLMPLALSPREGEPLESASARMQAPPDSAEDSENDRPTLDAGENCDFPLHITDDSEQSHSDIAAPSPPPFTVTTEYTDEESEINRESVSEWDPRATWGMARTYSEDDDEESFGGRISARRSVGGRWEERWRLFGRSPVDFQARTIPSSLDATLQAEPLHSALGEEGDMLAPHARFSIKKDKSKCSIKFDPPVSGRFILLKLWSQSRDQNIDIQNVVTHGFAGPRYFPAVEMR